MLSLIPDAHGFVIFDGAPDHSDVAVDVGELSLNTYPPAVNGHTYVLKMEAPLSGLDVWGKTGDYQEGYDAGHAAAVAEQPVCPEPPAHSFTGGLMMAGGAVLMLTGVAGLLLSISKKRGS